MAENNPNPAATPPGQPAGDDTPSGAASQAPAAGKDQPSGGVKPKDPPKMVEIPVEELNTFKRKSGRWDAHLKRNRGDRRKGRRSAKDYNADENTDPDLLEGLSDRDDKIDELSSANVKLEVKDQVRNLIETPEYKDLPQSIRRAVIRNPLGFAKEGAESIEDAVADIQEYLDDELDNLAGGDQTPQPPNAGNDQPSGGVKPPVPGSGDQTPPAAGSGPSSPTTDPKVGTEGKTGKDRSTSVLQNILKNAKEKQ